MKTNQQKFIALLALFIFFISCKSECNHDIIKINDSRPANAITYMEMASMFDQYDTGQKIVLDTYRAEYTKNPKDTIESYSQFYDLDQLKQYIAYIEKLSKEKDIKLTGVRIFSAAYPNDYIVKELRGRQTLIFMPTAKIGENNDVAFEPLYSEKGKPIKFTEFLHKYSGKEATKVERASFLPFLNTMQEDLNSSGANRMRPYPPL